MHRLIIVGAGGFGREVLIYAQEISAKVGNFAVGGFLDSNPHALDGFDIGAHILGDERNFAFGPNDRFVIATGDPELRARIYTVLADRGAQFMTLVHPMSWIASTARIGPGTIVAPFSSVNSNATVGENVAINCNVGIGHDTNVGAHSAISPFAVITGSAVLGEKSFLGSSCVIAPRKVLGRQTTISAGSVVFKNVPDNALARGNPATIELNWRKPDN